jgi:two-component system sensor histidine kinase/response regulator
VFDDSFRTGISSLGGKFLKAHRILVADDSKVCRKLLMRLLKSKGHTCDEAENGLRSVEMVKQAMLMEGGGNKNSKKPYYDTILLDNEMPMIMKGPEAASEMRKLGCASFIAGVTGNVLPEDVLDFKQHGADCVLPKPLNMGDLESKWVEHGVLLSM